MASFVPEVAASLNGYVMIQSIKIQMLNYHFIILSLEEQESAVIILQIGKLRLQEVK